ncbi:MAG TPA: apolipoprotein N-acyltransferase [Candidatus Baltobacteraceae bacterium]|nr:apolipoprotein N-acyltransferase [Candidatus Baltobacteraceae bacterium]
MRAVELVVCTLGALALAFAFPKAGQAWLAPFGAAALFWAWQRLSWKRAFFTGWFAGTIFFIVSYSWFTYTVGGYVGSLAFAVVFIPAVVDALSFGAAALCFRAAQDYAPAWAAPAAGAAAFTVFEWLRSAGVLGVPFAQIGYTQTATPLGIFAAYVGCVGVTFIVMLLGAYLAQALARRRAGALAAAVGILAVSWCLAYALWPARHAPAPHMRVAAVQGNIAQSIKWDPQTLPRSVARYTALTRKLAALHPQLVVWPETVITADLDDEPGNWNLSAATDAQRRELADMIATDRQLSVQFSGLARDLHTTLSVGSLERRFGDEGLKEYNALYTYAPNGTLINVYDKRQLVPFAESLPAPALTSRLPYAALIGRFGHGRVDAVVPAGAMRFAPLICWESAFADLVHAQIRAGAQFLVIPTDDAWFGPTSGTYQHAQIAQMRAIESGEWVIQAASTGISGIIAPTGSWVEHTELDRQAILAGNIGLPPGSLFARIGPYPVVVALLLLYLAIVGPGLCVRILGARSR